MNNASVTVNKNFKVFSPTDYFFLPTVKQTGRANIARPVDISLGAGCRTRTRHLMITNQLLYQMS